MPCQTRKLRHWLTSLFVSSFQDLKYRARQLHTDQEQNFESWLFQEMCRNLEIDEKRTTSLPPQSNSMVEWFNRTLEATLSKFVDENQKGWDLYLPLLMMAYCSSVHHEFTRFSLNNMMFGHEVLLPLNLVIGQAEPAGNSTADYTAKLSKQMEWSHEFACQHSKLSSDHQKNYYHCPINQHQYDWGDAVDAALWWPLFGCEKDEWRPQLHPKGPKLKPKVVHHDRLNTWHFEVLEKI